MQGKEENPRPESKRLDKEEKGGNRRADAVSCLNGYHRAKDWHWSQRQGTITRSEVKQHVRDQSKTSGEFGGRKYRSKIKPAG